MVIKSLIFGLIFTLGIFAVKSGIGLFYVLNGEKRNYKVFLLSFVSYFSVFALSFFIIVKP